MFKNWQIRLNDTLGYIKNIPGIPPAQFAQLKRTVGNQQTASDQISLGGIRLSPSAQETQRRHALRGLLLCLVWAGGAGARNAITTAKMHYQNASESELRDAIASFFPTQSANAQTAIKAALQPPQAFHAPMIDINNVFKYRRGGMAVKGLVAHAACYESVNLWLYLGGVVSLRWLLAHGNQPGHQIPSQWNWGQQIDQSAKALTIPAGQFCRFFRPPAGLHYTLSIGDGNCVGNHNSQDVIRNWVDGYGSAPTPNISRFSIAGYLATMQALVPSGVNFAPGQKPHVRIAPCVPVNPF